MSLYPMDKNMNKFFLTAYCCHVTDYAWWSNRPANLSDHKKWLLRCKKCGRFVPYCGSSKGSFDLSKVKHTC